MTKHRKKLDLSKSESTAAPGTDKAQTQGTAVAPPAQPKLKSKKEKEEVKEPGAVKRLFIFFKDAKRELSRVTWPGRKETVKSTGVLLVLVALSAVYLALVDGILTRLLKFIVG
ncbi:MAG: preprotein translocase subunit SecE [Deltaproteobacteria bacterium]|jgi:preprotein translocase subunit SecE|nr:preprotein translocase subunit SecE [Deltaproteobacteria bacterium]